MKISMEKVHKNKLVPNEDNPRRITSVQMGKLKESLRSFLDMMEVRPIIVDEKYSILCGNQRYYALMDMEEFDVIPIAVAVDITDDERRILIVKDNVEYGEWDWEKLKQQYQREELIDLHLPEFLINTNFEVDVNDPTQHWDGMPEFEQDNIRSFKRLIVHFRNEDDMNRFATLVGQDVTVRTPYIWYPEVEKMKTTDKGYVEQKKQEGQ